MVAGGGDGNGFVTGRNIAKPFVSEALLLFLDVLIKKEMIISYSLS